MPWNMDAANFTESESLCVLRFVVVGGLGNIEIGTSRMAPPISNQFNAVIPFTGQQNVFCCKK